MDRDFLGKGWSFPPDFTRPGLGVAMLEQDADVASSLEILLGTVPGERIMQPRYGCNLRELCFETLDTRIKTLMIDKIETAILYFEPRITLESVTLYNDRQLEGIVLIDIIYRVKTTNSRFNFVYPYYIDQGTDINLTTSVNLLPEAI
ncbi:GPW/gp25 family protein [Sphingobium rhizovicinum]|uniref:GPW/gp25 family protein n=1 Tax=Sphingobium rhizovicinum TaxID=432308 RepID=A0ABV7NJX4_9SPHN